MADWATGCFFLTYQIIITVLFALFTKYKPSSYKVGESPDYSMFQDIHIMVFVGFGYIMTFLKRYGFSSAGFNFLLAASLLEWGILCDGLFEDFPIQLNLTSLVKADILAATCLISMGVLLGRTTPLQLLIMGLIEGILFKCNEHIVVDIVKATDEGGSMTVHVFGTYFAIGISWVLGRPKNKSLMKSTYTSDLFGMLGCVLLWAFWPSFTAIGSPKGEVQERAVINTYISIASSCVTSFAFSALVNKNNKFNMVHIQNGSLAGGVAMGAAVDLLVHPFGAVIIGSVGGIVCVMGFAYLQPWLEAKLRIHDTCGVHNLHALPGIVGGIVSAIVACFYDSDNYSKVAVGLFPEGAESRTPVTQGGYQLLGLVVSIVVPLIGGLLTGIFLRVLSPLTSVPDSLLFSDDQHWELEEDEETPQMKRSDTKTDQESAVTNSFQIM